MTGVRLLVALGMPQQPEAFMGSDQALHVTASAGLMGQRLARHHDFQRPKQGICDIEIRDVARLVEGDQDLVR